MSRKTARVYLSSAIILWLCLPLAGQDKPANPAQIPETTSQETTLRALAQQYLEAYSNRDLNGMMAFWSPTAPEFAMRRQQAQPFFDSTSKITLTQIELQKLVIDGDRADLEVSFELSAVAADTGHQMEGLGKITRSLQCVKQEGLWKIWRDADATYDFAILLLAAKSGEEKSALLSRNVKLVTPYLVDALVDEARKLQFHGEYERALSVHNTAYGIATVISYKRGMARSLNNIGALESSAGKYSVALQTFNEALAIANTLEDKTMVGRVLGSMSDIYLTQGNFSLALENLQKSLQIFESIESKWDIAYSLNKIADVYLVQNDFAEALSQYQQSLDLSRKMGDKGMLAGSLQGMGWVHLQQGESGKAAENFQQALKFYEESGAKPRIAILLYSMGALYWSQKDYEQASSYFNRSLKMSQELGDQKKIAFALGGVAETYLAKGDFEMALEYADRVSAIARTTGDTQLLSEYRGIAGQAYQALHQPIEARKAIAEAISVVESMRENVAGGEQQRQTFFASKVEPYHDMVELLVAESQFSEALLYAERAKGRTLAEVLGNGRVNITKAMTEAQLEREQELQAKLVSLNRQLGAESAASKPDQARLAVLKSVLEETRLQYSDFRTNLYVAHPELRAQRGQIEPISLSDVASFLPDNRTAIIEFLVADERTYLFVLTRSAEGNAAGPQLSVHTIDIKAKDLGQETEEFRRQLSFRDLKFQSSALKLFKLFVQPAQSQLAGVTHLLIVPDGPLWNLPFQALQLRRGHYLLERYALSYAPSLTILREMVRFRLHNKDRPPITAGQTLMAMGNPVLTSATSQRAKLTYRDENLAPLPEAAKEVKALQTLYGRQQSKIFLGAEAAEDRFKAQAGEFRILHLATHGLLDDTSPMYSHLLLSTERSNTKEDGLLEAWEIMNLDLHADLVVLSACETARGRITSGEGVIGLTWAFFVAGVPTTVVSQWKVESASTSKLMLTFHRALKAEKSRSISPFATARALQGAELQLLHNPQYSHPFYWAGFVVVGDPK